MRDTYPSYDILAYASLMSDLCPCHARYRQDVGGSQDSRTMSTIRPSSRWDMLHEPTEPLSLFPDDEWVIARSRPISLCSCERMISLCFSCRRYPDFNEISRLHRKYAYIKRNSVLSHFYGKTGTLQRSARCHSPQAFVLYLRVLKRPFKTR